MNKEFEENIPQIYVACLSAYNNGCLHGKWIEITNYEEIKEQINDMLKKSPFSKFEDCEEYAIHDYENFGDFKVSEYSDIRELCEFSELLFEYPDFREILGELVNDYGIRGTKNIIDDKFLGNFNSLEDYYEEMLLCDDSYKSISLDLRCYFDIESYARDQVSDGDIIYYEDGDSVFIFTGI